MDPLRFCAWTHPFTSSFFPMSEVLEIPKYRTLSMPSQPFSLSRSDP
jgi:hypothetical protein